MAEELPVLNPIEARLLGCLAEKKELTPDVYPMTLNALQAAANQKTSREPVMALDAADIHRGLKSMQQKGLVRQQFASRVERYEHLLANVFSLTQPQVALLALMLLRGPQTVNELLTRSERMARFASVDDLRGNLDLLIGRRPPLVQHIERGPGQREDRYAQLLGGPVQPSAPHAPVQATQMEQTSELEARIEALEKQVELLSEKVRSLAGEQS